MQFIAIFLDQPGLDGFHVVSQELPNVAPTDQLREEHILNAEMLEDRFYQISGSHLLDLEDGSEDDQEDSDSGSDSAAPPALTDDVDEGAQVSR